MPKALTAQTTTRIFPEAGHLVLIKHNADRSDSTNPEEIYTSDAAVVDNIQTSYSLTTEDMNDGNAFDPAASHVTARDGTADIVLNTFDQKLWSFLTGAVLTTEEDEDESNTIDYMSAPTGYVIGDDGTVKIDGTLSAKATFPVIVTFNGTNFTKAASDPKEGEFTVDTDTSTLTFNEADKGKSIYVTAMLATKKRTVASVSNKPKQTEFTAYIVGKNCDKGETDEIADWYKMDSVKVNGDISLPQRGKSYTSWTVSLKLTAARPGKNAIEWGNAAPSERAE